MVIDRDIRPDDRAKYAVAESTLLVDGLMKEFGQLVPVGERRRFLEIGRELCLVIHVATGPWRDDSEDSLATYSDDTPVFYLGATSDNETESISVASRADEVHSTLHQTGMDSPLAEAVLNQIANCPPGWQVIVAGPPRDRDQSARRRLRELLRKDMARQKGDDSK